jgi:FKBP-type peptidyl-prolyl cis-trans isomerase 2
MRTAQRGDRAQVHYVKRYQDGTEASSQSGGGHPLEVTVGADHPRLRGLGAALVGLAPGERVRVAVPAAVAHGDRDPGRVHLLSRRRFPELLPLTVGGWVRVHDRRGRLRLVRVVEVRGHAVRVDTNHPRAGQGLVLEVELLSLRVTEPAAAPPAAEPRARTKVVALDADPDSLVSLRQAFPDAEVEALDGVTAGTLQGEGGNLGGADLLVVGAREDLSETLGLCRCLRGRALRPRTPLLVLVPAEQGELVRAALEAGADSCLVVPAHPKDLIAMLVRARAGNRPGHHTLGLDRAQREDEWRDEGGES